MHNLIEYEIWHQHREELAQEISRDRQIRTLRPARPKARPLNAIVGRIRARMAGRPQAAR